MQHLTTMNGDKPTGSFYTPEDIAGYIAENTIEAYLTHASKHSLLTQIADADENARVSQSLIDGIRILDPAVGEGVFLLAAGEYLLKMRQRYGDTRPPEEIKAHIVKRNLFGVELLSLPTRKTRRLLLSWCDIDSSESDSTLSAKIHENIKQGNSLIGHLDTGDIITECMPSTDINTKSSPFHWNQEFPQAFQSRRHGFDVIIANPPYGNIMSKDERQQILGSYPLDVVSGRNGSWNIACLFVVRSAMLLSEHGQMGLILPNSFLRVGQFEKIRKFIFGKLHPWEIVDEGKAWDDVTLEMITLFCSKRNKGNGHPLEILSKREELEGRHWIPRRHIDPSTIISLYQDDFYERLIELGETNILSGSRGRDIPSKHLRRTKEGEFLTPFATKGRSIGRYELVEKWMKYTDDWYKTSKKHMGEIGEKFLIATKNLAYPRCVMKPRGYLHGGGVVRISIANPDYQMETIGLILNSRIAKYISIRYLTNYSKYTTCMNTGILERFPVVYPDAAETYSRLFNIMQQLLGSPGVCRDRINFIDNTANALVYSDYLDIERELREEIVSSIKAISRQKTVEFITKLQNSGIEPVIRKILNHPKVLEIERAPRMA
ncbi:hypothetical protein EU537_08580 [Candidatus Thorarchaeota archaeon]|nr:MAG: hypothetical protein EU537_08580 [Candidatus Thorarchaeota archaeon]